MTEPMPDHASFWMLKTLSLLEDWRRIQFISDTLGPALCAAAKEFRKCKRKVKCTVDTANYIRSGDLQSDHDW